MADYYPLISRAVAGLEKNNGENRRALYERARAALLAQLRGVTPALNESDITRERLALEESIRKVEADERALASLRDDLHNASVAAAQAGGEHLAPALAHQRDLQRELDSTLADALPVLTRLAVLRRQVATERRAAQLTRLRAAGIRFTEAAGPVTETLAHACGKLAALTQAPVAVTEAARSCGPDVLRDVTAGLRLAEIAAWVLNQLDDAGLRGIAPATMPYDPHQRAPGVTPTEASADLTVYLETTR